MGLQVQITIVVVQSTCLLLALFGGVNTQTRLANPVIASTPLVPELGQNLTLHCNAPAGVNVSRFSWLKNFAVLVGNEGPSISLNPLTKSDDGVYVCLYFNENNSQSPESNQYDLLVSPPDPPVLEANPPGPLFQTSGYVYLTCKTSGNNVQTYFFRNGVLITTQTWSTYYIYPNSRSLSGNYTCSARNSKGQSEPSNIVKIIFVGKFIY
ncbi:unnamed protein product [Lymnaea stagnalis]|uniref:Ig-like domain-containing protein n=1 Tax=Lymnaea stagnalis TaxID=6523 RepID=A0AAV2IQ15_LYMST